MINKYETPSEYLARIGSKGGKKTASRGADFYREIQKKSVASRRRKAESLDK